MNIMTRRGSKDNIITYEHMCDTTADLANIDPSYITLGSIAIILQGDTGLEVYMANSDKEWVSILTGGGGSSSSTDVRAYICSSEEVDSETGLPDIILPDENTFYFVATEDDETVYNVYKYEDGEWVGVSAGEGGSSPAPTPAPTPEENDVNFYDYDGTLVYSYSGADFLQLEAMPANPDHTQDFVPLTSQGWNWSLSDAKDAVSSYGKVDIGQIYVPTDKATHIVIDIPKEYPNNRCNFAIPVYDVEEGDLITIDWGDNTINTYDENSDVEVYYHSYQSPGIYNIKISAEIAFNLFLYYSTDEIFPYRIKNIFIGEKTIIQNYCFNSLPSPFTITFPSYNSNFGDSYCTEELFRGSGIKFFALPDGCTTLGGSYCDNALCLTHFSLPKSITEINGFCFNCCTNLYKAILPSVQTIYNDAFTYSGLLYFIFNENITYVDSYLLSNCHNLCFIIFSSSITALWNGCCNAIPIGECHFKSTTPPTMSSLIEMNDDTKIYVPYSSDHSVLNAYKTATNWVSLANYIYEEPQS